MKVAHISPSFFPARVYGGPTESIYQTCLATAAGGCNVRVLTTNANGRDQVLQVSVNREMPMGERLTVRYSARQAGESMSTDFLRRLHSYIEWADVVHLEAVYSFPTIPTLWVAGRLRKPIVWSSRGALARWKGARRPHLKSIYDSLCRLTRGDRVTFHFTSEPEREASLQRFPGLEGVVIPNGVHCPDEANPGQRGETLRLLYLGRLDPIKGIENLLEACGRLNGSLKGKWRLTLAGAGDPSYTATLKASIDRLGLTNLVHLVGSVAGEEKERCFATADLVVVPSHLENFCIVVAEALAHGVPVVASRGTPWPRLESEGCGLWVENDPATLARAIERISAMPLAEMGKKGRAWMRSDFTWSRVGAQMIQLYQRLAERNPA